MRAIKEKASYDTLATLAIIMRPYGTSPYLSDSLFKEFATNMHGNDPSFRTTTHIYTRNKDVLSVYEGLAGQSGDCSQLKSESQSIASKMSNVNAVKLLVNYYTSKAGSTGLTAAQLFAEAELRVISATILDNSEGRYDKDELLAVYRNCTLSKPYMCESADSVRSAGVGFYYSTVYLIARSDALWYQPGVTGDSLSSIANDGAFISLNEAMESALSDKRKASQSVVTQNAIFKY